MAPSPTAPVSIGVVAFPHRATPHSRPRPITRQRTARDDCSRVSSGAGIQQHGRCLWARAWATSRCWRSVGGLRPCCADELHALPPTFTPASPATTSVQSSKQQGDIVLKAHVANIFFKCFKCVIWMLQVFHNIASVSSEYCKCFI